MYPVHNHVSLFTRSTSPSKSDDRLVGSVSIFISKCDLDEVGRERLLRRTHVLSLTIFIYIVLLSNTLANFTPNNSPPNDRKQDQDHARIPGTDTETA
jgi:hypothetical protein